MGTQLQDLSFFQEVSQIWIPMGILDFKMLAQIQWIFKLKKMSGCQTYSQMSTLGNLQMR